MSKTYAQINAKGNVFATVQSAKPIHEKEGMEVVEIAGRVFDVVGKKFDRSKKEFYRMNEKDEREAVPVAEKITFKNLSREYLQQKQQEKQQARQDTIDKLRAEGRVE